jgi:uncharacterized protein YcnI
LIWAGLAASVAGAHAIVRPGASRPAEFQEYTLTVPTERDQPTVGVVLKVPEGITFLLVENTPGWTAKIVRRNDRIDEIHWSGGSIPPDFFGTFRLIGRNPVAEGEIAWRILQLYKGGETVRWIGGPDSASPAARTDITESAVPVDVVNVTSGRPSAPAAGGATTTPAATTTAAEESDDDGDGAALALAVVGLIAGLAALAVAVVAWRTARSRPRPAGAPQ